MGKRFPYFPSMEVQDYSHGHVTPRRPARRSIPAPYYHAPSTPPSLYYGRVQGRSFPETTRSYPETARSYSETSRSYLDTKPVKRNNQAGVKEEARSSSFTRNNVRSGGFFQLGPEDGR